jgi:hypothetical protein
MPKEPNWSRIEGDRFKRDMQLYESGMTLDAPTCVECGDTLTGHEDDSGTHCRWCVTCVAEGKDDLSQERPINRPSELGI